MRSKSRKLQHSGEVAGSQQGEGVAVTGLVDVLGEHLAQVGGEPAHLVVLTEVVPTEGPQIEKQPDTVGSGQVTVDYKRTQINIRKG